MLVALSVSEGSVRAASGQTPTGVHVAYPGAGAALDFGDSTFLFGYLDTPTAKLTVADQPVKVAPNGAWLAWVALPHDSSFVVKITVAIGDEVAVAWHRLSRAGWVRESGAWVDLASRSPTGSVWLPKGEPLPLTVRAAPGAVVRLLLPNGKALRFLPDSIAPPPRDGLRNFDGDDRNLSRSTSGDHYVATLMSDLASAVNAGRLLDKLDDTRFRPTAPPMLEVALHGKVTKVPWPIHVTRISTSPVAVFLDDDIDHHGGTDRITIGRALQSGTYAWFFPAGTRTRADMRVDGQVRLRLSRDAVAWVPLEDVHRAAAPDDARRAIMTSPVLTPDSGRTRLRVPLTRPVPLHVDETERGLAITLHDAVSDANWTRYGADQRFVQRLTWNQETDDRITLSVAFDRPLWGWRVRVDGSDLVFDFREPPAIVAARPLADRRIVIDPGHPPGGACGPTGLCEPVINLTIANMVREQLESAGANVIMTRTGPGDVGLWPRVALADSINADLMVSIHNNAFPDGVNPFTNSGTSTFFNHPGSLALARAVQARLVANIGSRDLGVARGDLALTRPTWYPAILTEGYHLIFPEQEDALRNLDGARRYANGVVEGITAFLHDAARGSRGP